MLPEHRLHLDDDCSLMLSTGIVNFIKFSEFAGVAEVDVLSLALPIPAQPEWLRQREQSAYSGSLESNILIS
jgi:hypothetical protein